MFVWMLVPVSVLVRVLLLVLVLMLMQVDVLVLVLVLMRPCRLTRCFVLMLMQRKGFLFYVRVLMLSMGVIFVHTYPAHKYIINIYIYIYSILLAGFPGHSTIIRTESQKLYRIFILTCRLPVL